MTKIMIKMDIHEVTMTFKMIYSICIECSSNIQYVIRI